jgi:O-antigen/teichoic acid export membrane protein
VTAIQVGVVMLSDLGIRQSIIRAKSIEDLTFLHTAWTVQTLRGLVIAGLVALTGLGLLVLGPSLAEPGTVYADPLLPFLVIVSALTVQIESTASVNALTANRKLSYMGRLAALSILSQLIAVGVTVSLAVLWPSVWALLLGGLVGASCRTILSHLAIPGPRMGFAWNKDVREELWSFGKWIIGSSALGFVTQHADRLILAALMPPALLGLYVIALLWIQAYGMLVARLSNQTGLPVLSEVLRDRPSDLPRLFRKYLLAVDVLCLFGYLIFTFGGQTLINLLYSNEYRTAGQLMPLLALWLLTRRFIVFSEILVAEGKSFNLMLSNALSAITICIAIPIGYSTLGVTGAIAASITAPLAGVILQLIYCGRIVGPTIYRDWAWLGVILGMTVIAITFFEAPAGF